MFEYNMGSLFMAAVKSSQGSHVSGAILITFPATVVFQNYGTNCSWGCSSGTPLLVSTSL